MKYIAKALAAAPLLFLLLFSSQSVNAFTAKPNCDVTVLYCFSGYGDPSLGWTYFRHLVSMYCPDGTSFSAADEFSDPDSHLTSAQDGIDALMKYLNDRYGDDYDFTLQANYDAEFCYPPEPKSKPAERHNV